MILLIFSPMNGSILDRIGEVTRATAERIRGWDLSMREAMFYEKSGDGEVVCHLCPWNCRLKEGERGICGVRTNIDGTLRAMVYGKVSSLNLDPVEKKPVYQFLPGTSALSVASVGCNLGCNFCQNWTLSQALPEESRHADLSPQALVEKAVEVGASSIAYTYSEPTVWYEYMYDASKIAHERGIKNIMVTCGYINPEPLRRLCTYMDAANVDLKGFSEDFYRDYTSSTLAPVKAALIIMKEEGVHVEVTNLLIPGANDSPEDIRALCEFIRDSLGPETPLHFSRFHPDYKLKDRPPTPPETLQRAWEIARELGLDYVYVGNLPGNPAETTFCPNCGEPIIVRKGYHIESINMNDGKCGACGHGIYGVW